MSRERQVLLGVLGIALLTAAAGEHVYRRCIEHRLHEVVAGRQRLELQFAEMVATHEQVQRDLSTERQHSNELTQALSAMRARMEEAVGRLTEETRTVRELQVRLATMQQQMDQLQGELAVALQGPGTAKPAASAHPVELERVVVSDGNTPGLQGRVMSVNRDWNFVVVDLGWDAVKIGDTISIFHDEKLLARARVERVQEGICAASVLPEWANAEIHVNDRARVL